MYNFSMVALEHTLIILLLLISLLKAQPRLPGWLRWTAAAAILFALVAPASPIELPWTWLAALFIPLLLWQTAQRLVSSHWPNSLRNLIVWAVLVLGVTILISVTAAVSPAGAFLFGLLLASTVWEASAEGSRGSFLGQIGVLTLAFLLAETDFLVEAPRRQALALLGGAGLGALFGSLSVLAALRLTPGLRRDLIGVAQAYLAYAAALLLDVSSVAAAVLSVIVFVAYGVNRRLWPDGRLQARPLDHPVLFLLSVIALAFFGWQTHVPLTQILLIEIILGLAVTAAAFWIGYLIKSPAFTGGTSFGNILGRAALLLVPVVFLWPRAVLLNPGPLAAALAAAALITLAAHYGLIPLLRLYGWMEEAETAAGRPAPTFPTLSVRDLPLSQPVLISPQVPARDLPRLFAERGTQYALVVDSTGCLTGILTEADLFIRKEYLPRLGRSYPSLFKMPVMPEQLPEVYGTMVAGKTAADLMTAKGITVNGATSVRRAIQLMYQHDLKILPVVNELSEGREEPVGVLTRAAIIHLLAETGNETSSSEVGESAGNTKP